MWLKCPESMLSNQKVIFSSARMGTQMTFGGVELLMVNSKLRVHFKRTEGIKRWRAESNMTGHQNKWMHVAATWAEGGFARLYIDGVLKATASEGTFPVGTDDPNTSMIVGNFNSGSRQRHGAFDLDEWYVWDRELSENQVKRVYAAYQNGTHTFQYSSSSLNLPKSQSVIQTTKYL